MADALGRYPVDDTGRRFLARSRARSIVWSLGFAGTSLAMLVTGGADVALISLAIILVIFVVGGLVAQRYEDQQDHDRQAAAAPDTFVTPAVRLLPGRAATKGDLQLSSKGLSWIPGTSSTTKLYSLAWSETAGVGVQPRGRLFRRASIIVALAHRLIRCCSSRPPGPSGCCGGSKSLLCRRLRIGRCSEPGVAFIPARRSVTG